jgi:FKBP-type peptidyl-prolyl cis-trans isomerase
MKLPSLLKLSLLGLGVVTTMSAQEVTLNLPGSEPKTPAALAAQPAESISETQILETFGWFVTMRLGIHELEFTPAQIAHFAKGVALAAGGNEPPHSLERVGPKMNEFIQARQDAVIQRFREENEREAREFFAKLKAQPNVKELPSGLRYEILAAGSAAKPKVTDTVTIRYTGTLVDGTVFDSTEGRESPAEISLQEVIPGWTEGVQLIGKGGKIKLYIPAHLAYGDTGIGDIPPGAALIFDVELIDFKPTPAPAAK